MAGVVLTVGVLAVTATLAVGVAAAGAASARMVRVGGAADAAALAAADAATGAISGVPCERAGEVGALVHAVVRSCTVEGVVATVTVTAPFGPFEATARARAGPPP